MIQIWVSKNFQSIPRSETRYVTYFHKMATKIIIAFDAYGTLLSTASIASELASHFGDEKGKSIAASWRKIQMEYTWRLNSMRTWFSRNKSSHLEPS